MELSTLIKQLKDKYGEGSKPRYMEHYIPARGYPGSKISYEERKCEQIELGNPGWRYYFDMAVAKAEAEV